MSALNIYAVGLDVSSRSSMASIIQVSSSSLRKKKFGKPFNIDHTNKGLGQLVERLRALNGDTKVILEHTGRYYECVAMFLHKEGFFVSAVNPLLIKEDGNGKLHAIKTDKADAEKIAAYGVKYWDELREYEPDDTTRYNLKTLNRQFQFYTGQRVAQKNNLTSLLEQSFPGIYSLFKSPARKDGHEKWVDFVETFWHVDCVRKLSLETFTEQYKAFCKGKGYNFSAKKAETVYTYSQELVALVPMSDAIKFLVQSAAKQLSTASYLVEALREEMNHMASQLPEYETVMSMAGVGESLGPQLIAEIGDIRRFKDKHSLVSYAGIDPHKNQSGKMDSKSGKASKRGSPYLRKALFLVMSCLMQNKMADDPVYQFLDRKRAEGKHFYVYTTAAANKFLRMYYGKVRNCLSEKGLWDVGNPQSVDKDVSTE